MKHWYRSFTYQPKIEPVFAKKCTQTIRSGHTMKPKDLCTWFEWEGKPYWSSWGRRLDSIIKEVIYIEAFKEGFEYKKLLYFGGNIETYLRNFRGFAYLDYLARLDGIDPPTGMALGKMLNKKQKLKEYNVNNPGFDMQIITWDPVGDVYRKGEK